MDRMCCAGIDVSAEELAVCYRVESQARVHSFCVANRPSGHRELIRRLRGQTRRVRVVLEATGVYHLELALALHQAERAEVMVARPQAMRRFCEALSERAKTDSGDARIGLEFCERMPFQPWQAPSTRCFELRSLTRRIATLTELCTAEKNRCHASQSCPSYGGAAHESIQRLIQHLDRELARLQTQALRIVRRQQSLSRRFDLLRSVHGIATKSALKILGELCLLPADMNPRQWVAHAGLDPKVFDSGSSVRSYRRISKAGNVHLRRALYMPALVASRGEPHVQAYYDHLKAQGKPKLKALVAVMRKLLHAIYGMFHHQTTFHGPSFYNNTGSTCLSP